MTEPTPSGRVRALCDRITELIEDTIPSSPVTQYGASSGGSQAHTRTLMTDHLIDTRTHLKAVLTSWALLIRDDYHETIDCDDETTSITGWIYRHADQLGRHPAFADFITETTDAIAELAREADKRIDDREFCGWHEGKPVYARRGQDTAVVDGAIVNVRDGRDAMRLRILGEDLTAKKCAVALSRVYGMEVTEKQILRTHERDKAARRDGRLGEHEGLSAIGKDGDNPKSPLLFRVEEVMARLKKLGQHAA